MFKVGEFSRLSNISIRMLRHYDKLGILIPEQVDDFTGYRYYSAAQLARANKIQKLRQMGFSLAITGEMLNKNSTDELERYFSIRKTELEEELAKISAQASLLEGVREIIREDTSIMNYNVVLKDIPERDVISVRKKIPNFQSEGMLWEQLFAEIGRQNVKMATPPLGISIYHDEEYKESDVDVEVQLAVEGEYSNSGEVRFYRAPSAHVASVTFQGPFEQMSKVTETAAKWIEDNNYRMNGPMFNISHVSPGQDPNPENWVTEACFTIEKV